jgi:hypothetical protein
MTTNVETPQARCRAGVARADITPPVGIYHRMWGAALHDRATGVHRPLLATALWLRPRSRDDDQLILAIDHCILDGVEMQMIRHAVHHATGIAADRVQIALSHTHGSGWMSRSRAHLPGGDLVGPYLDALAITLATLAKEAQHNVQPATIVFGRGRCNLAAQRDFLDDAIGKIVCGFNPDGVADDTLLVGRIARDDGTPLASLVNYACHPTTLAWENTALSPDYVGAMREVVERETGVPCVFLQGASGDLGPREGFVGDWNVADRNGRQLGFAALSALEALPRPGTRFEYAGAVVSGAVLGTWKHEALDDDSLSGLETWSAQSASVPLAYRHDLPDRDETERERACWLADEEQARLVHDETRVRDCRAKAEQMTRQLHRLDVLPKGKTFPLPVTIWRLGGSLWVFVPGEMYQQFQTALRGRFPGFAVVVATLTGDWQPGYLPAARTYGYGIYQEIIAAVAAGSLEVLIEEIGRRMQRLVDAPQVAQEKREG